MALDPRPRSPFSVGPGVVTGHQTGPDRPGAVDGDPDHPAPQSADAAVPASARQAVCGATYRGYSTKHSCQCHRKNLARAPCNEAGRHNSAGDAILPSRAWWREPARSVRPGERPSQAAETS